MFAHISRAPLGWSEALNEQLECKTRNAFLRALGRCSVLPKGFKPLRAQLRITHGVRNVAMPEILLDRARVVPIVSELVTRGVPQHVQMNGEGQFRAHPGAR